MSSLVACLIGLIKCLHIRELGIRESDRLLLLKSLELFLERNGTIDSNRVDLLRLAKVILLEEETHQEGDTRSPPCSS